MPQYEYTITLEFYGSCDAENEDEAMKYAKEDLKAVPDMAEITDIDIRER